MLWYPVLHVFLFGYLGMPLLCLFFHVLMPDLEMPEHPPGKDRLVAACAVERVCKAPVH